MATEFTDRDLRGARFRSCDLSGASLRGVVLDGVELDSPWLLEGGAGLVVNGVEVTGFVDAELDRRHPGRALRRATSVAGLQEAWQALEEAWSALVVRAESLPAGAVDVSVEGEWSFAQTLRHLVTATDVWLRGAVLDVARPYHPLGLPHAEYETDGYDMSVFATGTPSWSEVRAVRAERQGLVREHLATLSDDDLSRLCLHPWAPEPREPTEPVLACLHTILEEEWEHLRYATRDLDAIAQRPG